MPTVFSLIQEFLTQLLSAFSGFFAQVFALIDMFIA